MERQTKQRHAIQAAIREGGRPLLPAEVVAMAQQTVPGINIATVYRCVKALAEEGVIRAVELPGEPARYERADLHHHHHFRCDDCERVFDVPGCRGGVEANVPDGFSVRAHEVVLFGRCAECERPKRRPARSTAMAQRRKR
jgi:Fur family ferric uptake transcriptional regulator